ncbi:MAG: folylpolyglutamate synthase/dihydrofolate synthase family protein [Pseudomonadota bacterium]
MNYNDTLQYLETLRPKDFRMELQPMIQACRDFGNPLKTIPSIHIGGTNGKGSTAAFCESLLRASGYKTGLFTSPHLIEVTERIQINRSPISKEAMASLATEVRDKLSYEDFLSYFEFLTLTGFLHFKSSKIDVAVLETGMGGRLDATNVISPTVVIITPISLDHTKHLGNSVVDIAREKCGIIKRGVPTICAEQPPEVMNVINHACNDIGSPLIIAHPSDIETELGLEGEHQKQNAACALKAVNLMQEFGFKIKDQRKALANTKWEGRLEEVSSKPKVILDGAHNPSGAKALAHYLKLNFDRTKTVVMMGMLADKDVLEVVRIISAVAREVICVAPSSSRAYSPNDLASNFRSHDVNVHVEEDIIVALNKWLSKLDKTDTLVVTGSMYLVGAAKKYFEGK